MRVQWLVWGGLSVTFFVSTLFLSLPFGRELFVSPDENAAYVFAKTFAETGRLSLAETLNIELGGLIHPRSTAGFGDAIVPASFIGFIYVLGVAGAIFGTWAMYLVTPTLAVLALVLWRDVIRRVFHDTRLANLAAFLLMIHPAFWYYTGRVMMHNVAFLTLLIAGVWWCLAQPVSRYGKKKYPVQTRLTDFSLAGALFGSALIIRTSELIWLTLAIIVVFTIYRAQIGWRIMAAFAASFLLMLGVLGAINATVYGSPFVNGYTARYPYAAIVTSDSEASAVIDQPKTNLLLPFGFHERVIIDNVFDYGLRLYPWMSVLAVTGLALVFTERHDEQRKLWRVLAVFTLALAAWLGVVYGSWKIIDNPDPAIISLGNSHVRYWLPLFALASVFAARAVLYMWGEGTVLRKMYTGGILALVTLLSFELVFFGHDGFVPSQQALATFITKEARVVELTEPDAIVIVDRADKYLFPERRVVVPLRSEATYAALPRMLEQVPTYYFGITFPEKDLQYLNQVKLAPLGVSIEPVETMQEESLYRFVEVR